MVFREETFQKRRFLFSFVQIRALSNLFIHVACIQSWSSCFNASLLATSVLVLSLKFMRRIRPEIPHLNYILWTCSYPVELVLGLAGYIAMIVADMPSEPTDRANHYFVIQFNINQSVN